ncbi:class I SAM-dependent methyltransferase [Wenzhouxiangella marina]|uniref:Methyltransferase n=1 Tax=Wenzhouxiangella marina TaxID=1579979 RepID=A0A0K0XUY9_9GAMM|nr:class I SAM-dependent methyltransferase [Wenzhouxiangella marina]AKS41436.1 methyltransferase [Wenzhouxiangella marina]MBB6086810.1 putative methyltransferase [Wenzhouxiangella marina]
MKQSLKFLSGSMLALSLSALVQADDHGVDERLVEIAGGDHRPAEWIERNAHRHPAETLSFFGLSPEMTVIELSPGGGWYTSVIAPFVKDEGQYVAAHWDMEQEDLPGYAVQGFAAFTERFGDEATYGEIEIIPFNPPSKPSLGEPGSADMVLTFRNVHGWNGDGILADVFESAREVLKRGGVLGVVGHRLPEDREGTGAGGYLKQSYIVGMAESHGFRLVEASEINANPADTADHPSGVWSLPPSLRDGEETADQYRAIGESDRFTLKFVKR